MAEKTLAERQQTLETNHQLFLAELQQADAVWQVKPSSGEGEAAWSAQEVGQHCAGSALFFGKVIAEAAGLAPLTPEKMAFANASEAVAGSQRTYASLAAVVSKLSDTQLTMEVPTPMFGTQTLGWLLGTVAYHYKDHAQQLKTLRGG